jgi:hypothetical protein
VTLWVRVEFTAYGERLHEFVGPFHDRWLAECVCENFAHNPYRYGLTDFRVERARIVAGGAE